MKKGPLITLVEPDQELADIYAASLKQAGYQVHVCHTAQAAIESVDKHKPDAVILELALARHNGIEFLYEFRSYHEWQQVPLLVLTHVPEQPSSLGQALRDQLHIAAYHYKPATSLKALLTSLSEVLAQPKPA